MRTKTYVTSVNVAIATGVISAFLYDSAGPYKWVALTVAGLSAIVATCTYFSFHWSNRQDTADCEQPSDVGFSSASENRNIETIVTSGLSSVPAPTYLIPVHAGAFAADLIISEAGRVHRVNVQELLAYLKFMERQGWSAPDFPLSMQREFRNRDVAKRIQTIRSKQPLSKARFRNLAVGF